VLILLWIVTERQIHTVWLLSVAHSPSLCVNGYHFLEPASKASPENHQASQMASKRGIETGSRIVLRRTHAAHNGDREHKEYICEINSASGFSFKGQFSRPRSELEVPISVNNQESYVVMSWRSTEASKSCSCMTICCEPSAASSNIRIMSGVGRLMGKSLSRPESFSHPLSKQRG
jgi:hypothetical protein